MIRLVIPLKSKKTEILSLAVFCQSSPLGTTMDTRIGHETFCQSLHLDTSMDTKTGHAMEKLVVVVRGQDICLLQNLKNPAHSSPDLCWHSPSGNKNTKSGRRLRTLAARCDLDITVGIFSFPSLKKQIVHPEIGSLPDQAAIDLMDIYFIFGFIGEKTTCVRIDLRVKTAVVIEGEECSV
jgi:hypothetical protein